MTEDEEEVLIGEDQKWEKWQSPPGGTGNCFDSADVGALAHLYRAEVYRSTTWRTRLDTTTNWSVVSLGIALSVAYANKNASELPLLLIGMLITMFLFLEARRYRYFNIWRARCRWMEKNFYAPMLFQSTRPQPGGWQDVMARDYMAPRFHIGFWLALGRRLRRNYLWIFLFQAVAYLGKISIHPEPVVTFPQLLDRMRVDVIPGWVMLAFGVTFHTFWICLTIWAWLHDRNKHADVKGVHGIG